MTINFTAETVRNYEVRYNPSAVFVEEKDIKYNIENRLQQRVQESL